MSLRLWGKIKKAVGIKNWKDGGREQLKEVATEAATTGRDIDDVAAEKILSSLLTPERAELFIKIRTDAQHVMDFLQNKQYSQAYLTADAVRSDLKRLAKSFEVEANENTSSR
jgi:plasmid stability protein